MIRKITLTALCALITSPAIAAGWETGRLDTGFLDQEGNYVELSYGSLDYSLEGTTGPTAVATHQMAKDQKRSTISGKFQIGNFDFGLTVFGSGAIQMDGQNTGSTSVVPSGDVTIDTKAFTARYSFNDNFSALVGLRDVKLNTSTLSTLSTAYALNATSKTGKFYGVAYEIPEYALKFDILRSDALNMGLTGTATGRPATGALNGVPFNLDPTSSLGVPEATTIKFQTGISENTLMLASIHKVKWKSSQVVVKAAGVPGGSTALDNGSNFANSTAYSLGLGRKLTEKTSASLSYSWEKGTGATSTSPFTMSNGSKTLSVGLKHTLDAITISGGLSYTKAGDVKVQHSSGLTANYVGNNVKAFGLKVGYNF